MARIDLEAGAVVAGRYRLERILGEGGMGVVWAATSVRSRRAVALKVLKAKGQPDVRRFLREARLAAAMRHPNVVAVHDLVELDDGTPVMVMERLVGETLGERLAREGTLRLPELARIVVPVASALAAAHALGIVHRDLKPDNVFLSPSGHGDVDVRVLDFGIAKLAAHGGLGPASGPLTSTGSMLGTPYYMAPEQVFGQRDVDARADVWALGVIAYEALSGRRPIEGRTFGQIFRTITAGGIAPLETLVQGLPADVRDLVGRMLSRDRASRPPDLREPIAVFSRHAERAGRRAGARWRRGIAIGFALLCAPAALALGAGALRLGARPRPAIARLAWQTAPDWTPPPGEPVVVPSESAAVDGAPTPDGAKRSARSPAARSAPAIPEPPASSERVPLPGGVHSMSPY